MNPLQSEFEKLPRRPIDIGHEFEASEHFPDPDADSAAYAAALAAYADASDAADAADKADSLGLFRGVGFAMLYTGAFAGAAFALYCLWVWAHRLFVWGMNP